MSERRRWSETFRALGSAVLSLLKAELEALEQDVARSTKQAAIGVGLFAAAGAFGFWTLGVATYFLIQLVALWLPLWAASLVITGLFAAVVAVLALIGARRLKRWENPLATARRRMDDHLDWWQTRVFPPDDGAPPGQAAQPLEAGGGAAGSADPEDDAPGAQP